MTGLCPYHEDTAPSLVVYDDGFYCHGCKMWGSLEMLYEEVTGEESPYVDKDWTAKRVCSGKRVYWPRATGYDRYASERHKTLLGTPQALWYLEDRGVSKLAQRAMLGYDSGWYIIPVFRTHRFSPVTGFVARASPRIERITGMRFDMPFGQGPLMYTPLYPWHRDNLFVVFGIFDALVLAALGFDVCTTTAGQLSFRPRWISGKGKKIYIIPDMGEDEAAYKLARRLGATVVHLDYDGQVKDPADYAKHGRTDELIELLGGL